MKRLDPEQLSLILSWAQRAEEDLKAAKALLKSEGYYLSNKVIMTS
jgi:hypothetical protein